MMYKTKETNPDGTRCRLFVDMDGTLAEWRNIKFSVDSIESTKTLSNEVIQKRLNNILYLPDYFKTLKPNRNVLEAVRSLIYESNIDVYILSCVLPDKGNISPLAQKNDWLNQYLPEIKQNHRIFVPCGQDKRQYVPNRVQKTDFLLDDYTQNLVSWDKEGKAIKLLNGVNASKGTWTGKRVSYNVPPSELKNDLLAIVYKDKEVRHYPPERNTEYIEDKNFLTYQELSQESDEIEFGV